MSNRMLKSAALAAATAWLLAGTAYADKTVIKFWDNQQTESGLSVFQQEAVKRFEAENPDIKVEVTTIPYPEYQQRLLTAVQAGNGPDVSTVDQIWNSAFAVAGAIQPLDDLAKQAGIKAETFFPGAWESANYNGQLWGIPFNVDVWFFAFVNKKLFQDAGVDPASIVTWQGLEAAAPKLTDKSKGQFAIGLTGKHVGLVHLFERRLGPRRQRQVRADLEGSAGRPRLLQEDGRLRPRRNPECAERADA
ncbi:MAG: extracellular solute-binding protein [Rhizobiales bacterium]|nr:extracellular solute-binding protein [Hyphomicrobiales bacterium]